MMVINHLLGYPNMKIYQESESFHFSLDSILLANFVTLNQKTKKILDIGTGNAVIPLVLSTKTKACIDGIEIQKKSCQMACKSVKLNKLENQINIINQDVNFFYNDCQSDFYDVITCNPPYFKLKEFSHLNNNEQKSIARHEIKLNLDQLFKISKKILKNNGIISVVHRPERLVEIIEIMRKYNIEPKKIQFVYPKLNKDANIILIEGSKNGNPGLKILKPIFIHNQDGSYTEEAMKYFK